MKFSRFTHCLLVLVLFASVFAGSVITARAQDLGLQVNPVEPQPPEQAPQQIDPQEANPQAASAATMQLPLLKAVLLVGPIDGPTGAWTRSEVANMDQAAAVLEANGVTVYRFYPPGNGHDYTDWSAVKTAAQGANFLFYRGHGVYDGKNPPTVGGFSLQGTAGSYFISSDDIRADLSGMAKDFIVMLYGCFTAGSSASDPGTITIDEAKRRVAQYAKPFFDIGAGGYYADWFGGAFADISSMLFAGKTLRQAYEGYFDFGSSTVYRTVDPDYPSLVAYLDKDDWGYWKYNYAFVGKADATLADLFVPLTMKLSSTQIVYLGTPLDLAANIPELVTVLGSGSFSWTATLENVSGTAGWLSLLPGASAYGPVNGTGAGLFTIHIDPSVMAEGTYTATLHVTASGTGVAGADQYIPVVVYIVKEVSRTYLPITVTP